MDKMPRWQEPEYKVWKREYDIKYMEGTLLNDR